MVKAYSGAWSALRAFLAGCLVSACATAPPTVAHGSAPAGLRSLDSASATDGPTQDAAADQAPVVDAAAAAADAADVGSPRRVDAGPVRGPDATATPVTQVFVHHPAAEAIVLRGDLPPLTWTTDLAPASVEPGVARFDLPAGGGAWRVKPMRKGAWAIGPNWVVSSGTKASLWPWFDPKTAAPRREDFAITGSLGQPRTVRVWLPPGYDENTKARYPLFVLHDGQNVFEDATASFGVSWKVGDAAHAGILGATIAELVIVGVDHAGAKRIYEYTPSFDTTVGDGGGGLAYLKWLEKTLLPTVAAKYRLRPEREARVVGGSSLGGLVSLYGAVGQPDVWGGATCMSGSWWWNGGAVQAWLPKAWAASPAVRLWLDAGTVQDGLAAATQVKDALIGLGLVVGKSLGWHVAQGAKHDEASWAARVHLALAFHFPAMGREAAFK